MNQLRSLVQGEGNEEFIFPGYFATGQLLGTTAEAMAFSCGLGYRDEALDSLNLTKGALTCHITVFCGNPPRVCISHEARHLSRNRVLRVLLPYICFMLIAAWLLDIFSLRSFLVY